MEPIALKNIAEKLKSDRGLPISGLCLVSGWRTNCAPGETKRRRDECLNLWVGQPRSGQESRFNVSSNLRGRSVGVDRSNDRRDKLEPFGMKERAYKTMPTSIHLLTPQALVGRYLLTQEALAPSRAELREEFMELDTLLKRKAALDLPNKILWVPARRRKGDGAAAEKISTGRGERKDGIEVPARHRRESPTLPCRSSRAIGRDNTGELPSCDEVQPGLSSHLVCLDIQLGGKIKKMDRGIPVLVCPDMPSINLTK